MSIKSSKMEPMEVEDKTEDSDIFEQLMEHVGTDGKFQCRFNYTYNMLLMVLAGLPTLNIIMSLTSPDHWCHVPGRNETNLTLAEWINLTIPRVEDAGGERTFSKCSMYNFSLPLDTTTTLEAGDVDYNQTGNCQYGWEYDTTWYSQTATSQEDWVCDKEMYIPNIMLFTKMGEMLGEICISQLGDIIGRRPVLFIAATLLVLGRCTIAFTAGLYTLFLVAVIVGTLPIGVMFQSPLIIGMEVSAVNKRGHIALLQCLGWTMGMCITPLIAWLTGGHWKLFMVLTSLPTAIVFLALRVYCLALPPSVYSRCVLNFMAYLLKALSLMMMVILIKDMSRPI